MPQRLADGDEYTVSTAALIDYGEQVFAANWTIDEGAGRPLTKGTGAPLVDPGAPLLFPRAFNRVSAPDANGCAGCHNAPIVGGGGDIVANVFVLGQRFDFLTFDQADTVTQRGSLMENGAPAQLQTVANSRNTLGMFGSGFIEMLARQMTADLQTQRDGLASGQAVALLSKGVSFGTLARNVDGTWDTSAVEGLTPMSLASSGAANPPSLVIRPFHQASAVVSLREFSNNAFNHHHGMQSVERFGAGADPDGDGVADELRRVDITAASVFQATMAVPGRVIPNDPAYESAILQGEGLFQSLGCASCHTPSLALDNNGWLYSEPNPYNPPGNLQVGDAAALTVDLTDGSLPSPRLQEVAGTVQVPAYTDLKLHDITCGPSDPNREELNMHFPPSDTRFFDGNSRFLTRKLWGAANEPPYFHHGQYTTLRDAVLAHCGEAQASRDGFGALAPADQNALVEFLKSLQVLPVGASSRVVDETGAPRTWAGLP